MFNVRSVAALILVLAVFRFGEAVEQEEHSALTVDDIPRILEQAPINIVIGFVSSFEAEKQAGALVACIEVGWINTNVTNYEELERCFSSLENWSVVKTETNIVASIDSPLVANSEIYARLVDRRKGLEDLSLQVVITFRFDEETKILSEWFMTVQRIDNEQAPMER